MTTHEVIRDLIEKVEAGSGPDRELDALIAVATSDHIKSGDYACYSATRRGLASYECGDQHWRIKSVPRVSASIDAAVALTEKLVPGWRLQVSFNGVVWNTQISRDVMLGEFAEGNAATEARSRLSATLRALLATREDDHA